jgi:hypothetical protein
VLPVQENRRAWYVVPESPFRGPRSAPRSALAPPPSPHAPPTKPEHIAQPRGWSAGTET